jgi:quinol monooxygenase YgiN
MSELVAAPMLGIWTEYEIDSSRTKEWQSTITEFTEDCEQNEAFTRTVDVFVSDDGCSAHVLEEFDEEQAYQEHWRKATANADYQRAMSSWGKPTWIQVHGPKTEATQSTFAGVGVKVEWYARLVGFRRPGPTLPVGMLGEWIIVPGKVQTVQRALITMINFQRENEPLCRTLELYTSRDERRIHVFEEFTDINGRLEHGRVLRGLELPDSDLGETPDEAGLERRFAPVFYNALIHWQCQHGEGIELGPRETGYGPGFERKAREPVYARLTGFRR